MRRDPLHVFLNEKTAGTGAPATSTAPVQRKLRDLDPRTTNPKDVHDPGDRAMLGLMLASTGLASRVIPWVANPILSHFSSKDSVAWHQHAPVSGASSVADAFENPQMPRSKLLGLFDIHGRGHALHSAEDEKEFHRAAGKLREIEPVVDSFIDKHHLAEKGVRVNLGRGPLGWALGSGYNRATKEVHLTSVGKEVALHELGHAADFTGSRLGRARAVLGPALERGVMTALPIAMIAGDRLKEMLPGTVDDHVIGFMQNHAPAIMGATLAATTLYPEAKASALAVRHIHQTEGPEAARAALKKLVPAWGSYLLGAIPAVVGMALARKYMREAREDKARRQQVKVGSMLGGIAEYSKDLLHVGKQIGAQTAELITHPHMAQRIGAAAKSVGTSPEFIHGALTSALPAALASLYMYGTAGGKHVRDRIDPIDRHHMITGASGSGGFVADKLHHKWREDHPYRFAGVVAAGAALSGGIIAKLMSDLQRVL